MATEMELLEAKLRKRLWELEQVRNRVTAPSGPWRIKETARYLDGGLPAVDDSWGTIALGETWRTEPLATWFAATAVVPDGWSGGPLAVALDLGRNLKSSSTAAWWTASAAGPATRRAWKCASPRRRGPARSSSC